MVSFFFLKHKSLQLVIFQNYLAKFYSYYFIPLNFLFPENTKHIITLSKRIIEKKYYKKKLVQNKKIKLHENINFTSIKILKYY